MLICPICKNIFKPRRAKMIYCSSECYGQIRKNRSVKMKKEILEKLVWKIPVAKIAEMAGVSSNAVAKWCKNFNIKTPNRGHWTKLRACSSMVEHASDKGETMDRNHPGPLKRKG